METTPRLYPPDVLLRVEMARRRITCEALARKAGLHRNTIYRLRDGIGLPTEDTARRVVAALGTDVHFVCRKGVS